MLVKSSDKDPASQFYREAQLNPEWFLNTILQAELWSKQRQILESVRDKPRTAVRACHGPGKTKTAARAAVWFTCAHPHSRVITTAPTWRQVKNQIWREMRVEIHRANKWAENYIGSFGPKPSQTLWDIAPDWFAEGRSTNDPSNFQGEHADHVLVIVDEASGVEQPIFDALEGYMTGPHARMLLLGNPMPTAGQFMDAFARERSLWNCISISVFDTPQFTRELVSESLRERLPSKAWVKDKLIKWLGYSPAMAEQLMQLPVKEMLQEVAARAATNILWQIKVMGMFPTVADENVIPLGVVEAANRRYLLQDMVAAGQALEDDEEALPMPGPDAEQVLGVDVARFGSDETVIAYRHGNRIRILEAYVGHDIPHTVGRVMYWRNFYGIPRVVVDDPGVGGGVTDFVRRQGVHVDAFNGGNTAFRPDIYKLRRSELWDTGGKALMECALEPDDQLIADLVAPTYEMTPQGQKFVEEKKHTKKRLGRSPDRGDAVLLTLVPPSVDPRNPPLIVGKSASDSHRRDI